MATFAVMAESKSGNVHQLRGGFATREDAEGHRVRMVHWKRVWIEERPDEPEREANTLPPLPWSSEWSETPSGNGLANVYIVDANGRKIMALWGKSREKELVAERVLSLVNGAAP